MAFREMEHDGGGSDTVIKYTSSTTPQSFSDVDISEYDGFEILIGASGTSSIRCATYVPASMINRVGVVRVPLITITSGSVVGITAYGDVDFVNKTIKSSNTTYYVSLYGIKN